jgi:hypothetical protein
MSSRLQYFHTADKSLENITIIDMTNQPCVLYDRGKKNVDHIKTCSLAAGKQSQATGIGLYSYENHSRAPQRPEALVPFQ